MLIPEKHVPSFPTCSGSEGTLSDIRSGYFRQQKTPHEIEEKLISSNFVRRLIVFSVLVKGSCSACSVKVRVYSLVR